MKVSKRALVPCCSVVCILLKVQQCSGDGVEGVVLFRGESFKSFALLKDKLFEFVRHGADNPFGGIFNLGHLRVKMIICCDGGSLMSL